MTFHDFIILSYYNYQNFRSSNLEITLPENRKVGSFLLKIDSCFLEEMKFISKLLPKFRRQIWCQEIPRLRLFIISSYYHKIIIKKSDLQNFKSSNFEISNLQISKFQNPKVRYTGLSNKLRFPDSQISKIHISQGCFHIFLVFFEINWQ